MLANTIEQYFLLITRGDFMNFIGSKVLETKRLILRPTIEKDLKKIWEILCIPEVNELYLTCKLNFDWDKESTWQLKKLERANDGDVFQWTIVKKDTNECIGQISVQEKGEIKSVRDIGWFIAPNEQRKGYAFEAAKKVLDYMFNEVEIDAIETGAAIDNYASWRLMQKLGFSKRGDVTHIEHYTFGGDKECYSYGVTSYEYKTKILSKKI